MTELSRANRDRLLPTYRWDEHDDLTRSELALRTKTTRLLLDFRREAEVDSRSSMPPAHIIEPIVAMNVHKRTAAVRDVEDLIGRIKNREITAPPASLIPTFMAAGHEIRGLEDGYLRADYPSQELFAYNRLGKRSWLNERFGEHCLTAIGFAHPNGTVLPSVEPTRVKAHPPVPKHANSTAVDTDWTVVSSKTPIATIHENGRSATMISRVTGAVDMTSSLLSDEETEAISHLSAHEIIVEPNSEQVLGQKALLLSALEAYDGKDDSPFYPVLQTVYLTQIR